MTDTDQITDALTREHRAIDGGIAAFLADTVDATPLREAISALRRHIYLEETFLFPPLKATMMMPIFVMLREHGELWRGMDETEARLDEAQRAGDTDIQQQCRDLLTLLDAHNSKEEPIIYPRADADLAPDVRAELAEFIAIGAYPDGWASATA
ncbi:Hemerythrin HHE cation binding domain protein [Microbacterium esteraromaticum]|uniref:Hemerythrin HHE cation binding domain protein n=1 Tax=Microbacterium esteraromaticum TaxID=57043 RepID=A0A1R4J9K6_9MICO|nr:hemerythrin domain-containing protein [Microbacterium esteraromaticum]SJN28604.1 Hemerythrin HHE cation binding domain protein [Microbacterium esteraromaticum]